jgi:hypothetical protein
MANRNEARTLIIVALLTLVVAGGGLYLGFRSPAGPRMGHAEPKPVDLGPIVYDMRSVRSDPDRVRLEWREVPGVSGYHVTVMTAADDSLFASPTLRSATWVIPPELRSKLQPQTVYHWKLRVEFPQGAPRVSDPAAFATQ